MHDASNNTDLEDFPIWARSREGKSTRYEECKFLGNFEGFNRQSLFIDFKSHIFPLSKTNHVDR